MRKNPNGAGTVYREKGRGWCSEAFVDLPDGRKKRVRGRGNTPHEAVRARIRAEEKLRNANPEAEKMTVQQLADRWYESAHASRWAAETKRSYRTALDVHILPELGNAKVGLVRAFDIQRVLDRIMQDSKGKHASVANRCRRVMHTMFGRAVEWGIIPANPVASVQPIRTPKKEQGWWTREQATKFLKAAEKSPYHDLFHAAIVTGLRVGELLALRWADFDGRAFHVHRTYSQSAPGRIQEHPKSDTSRRTVPVPPELADKLEGSRGRPEELVFASRRGRLLNPSNVRRALVNYATRAGVPVIRQHDLRRTYASLLAEEGYHPSVIQRLLGHSSPDLALRVYTSVRDSVTSDVVVSLGGKSGGSPHGSNGSQAANMANAGGSGKAEQD